MTDSASSDPIRMLHFADTHIGMENYGRTDPETGLSSRVMDFLKRMEEMIDYARTHDVDLVVFAGDAFKSRNPSPTFQREFAYRVQDLARMAPVVLLVGNHDLPMIEKRASSIEIYDTLNVPNTILGRDYAVHEIETKRGPVMVATAPYPVRSLLREIDTPHASTIAEIDALLEQQLDRTLRALADQVTGIDRPRVLTGHFSVTGAVLGSERSVMLGRDVMVMLSTIADPVWDYVALGHIHKHQCLTLGRADAPPVVYSGSLERIDFGEEGDEKGFCWVELARGSTAWRFIPAACRPFVTLRVDVRGAGDPTQIALEAIARHDLDSAVVRMIITADPESDLLLNERAIQHALIDAGANHVAALQRSVERPARLRLGATPEGLTPVELLERYLATKEVPADRVSLLLDHAREIFEQED
ncbi:MAG: exonuclease SbcCD subunit D [Anaerolineae bacterium]|nr:exonuclease SbcCD subunit D [Anaerolineae bacterium]